MQPIIATTMAYAAFDRLLFTWNPHNSPRPKLFIPFFFDEWLSSLRHAKDDFQKELRDNWLKLNEKGKIDYLEELRTQLDAATDAIAKLPSAQPIKLRQVLKRNKHFPHSDAYKRLIDSLSVRKQEVSGPQRDEAAALPFQNEAVQADFFEIYLLIAQRLTAVKQEPTSDTATGKQQRKAQPAFTWTAKTSDLLDLILTLKEKNHLIINETDMQKLGQIITSLFQLPHGAGAPDSTDSDIFKTYLNSIRIERDPVTKAETKIYKKRSKNSLYKGILPPKR